MLTLLATSGINDLLNKILGIAMPVLIGIAVVLAFKDTIAPITS